MRIGLERLAIPHTGSPLGIVTISAGLAVLDPHRFRSAREVLKEADELLYRAKELGRNRIELAATVSLLDGAEDSGAGIETELTPREHHPGLAVLEARSGQREGEAHLARGTEA